jgi:hypothetical protein
MVCFHNASIWRGKNGTPYQLFTGQESPWSLNDFRIFGCPVYVLHKRLQDSDNLSKWKTRSWRRVYIGPSTCHAHNIPLTYNPATTHLSPQFHIVYDEGFTSVSSIPLHLEELYLLNFLKKPIGHMTTKPGQTMTHIIFLHFGTRSPGLLPNHDKPENVPLIPYHTLHQRVTICPPQEVRTQCPGLYQYPSALRCQFYTLRLYQPPREQDEIIFSQGLYQFPRGRHT